MKLSYKFIKNYCVFLKRKSILCLPTLLSRRNKMESNSKWLFFTFVLLLSNHILLIRISHNKFFRKKSPKEKQLYVKYVCYLKYLCIHCLYFLWNVLRQNKCSLCRNLHVSWGQSILKSRFELKGISALSSKKLKSCPPKISNHTACMSFWIPKRQAISYFKK